MIQIDNNGQSQVAEDTSVGNEGYRIDLSSDTATYSKATSYQTKDGHTVSYSLIFPLTFLFGKNLINNFVTQSTFVLRCEKLYILYFLFKNGYKFHNCENDNLFAS